MYKGKGHGVMGIPQLRQVTGNIQKAIADIKGVTEQGMIAAMEVVHKKADKTVAIDTGALRSSWFVVTNSITGVGVNPKFGGGKSLKTKGKARKARIAMVKANHSAVLAEAMADARSDPSKITVVAGYSAPYALYVHEMNRGWKGGLHVEWTKAGTENQWLEKAFSESSGDVLKIIKQYAKLI